MLKLEPYVVYNGNCEEAFNFYKSILGGEFMGLIRHKDNPEKEHPLAKQDEEKILHIALPVGKTVILMGADATSDMPVNIGNNITLSLSIEEEQEVRRLFKELSVGGKVIQPLEKNFWADLYGVITDKFGINWIVNRAKGEDV
ncbi:MAG: VOC family protein [Bacteroides sp.]|nr:VOC family protein [Bacteroides sp.]